jgi:hypothetical protein
MLQGFVWSLYQVLSQDQQVPASAYNESLNLSINLKISQGIGSHF